MLKTKYLINFFYIIIGLSICYSSNNSGLPLTKDELYYLTISDDSSGLNVLTVAKGDSLNFLWPYALYIVGVEEYDKYYRYLGTIFFIFALWEFVGKSQKIRLLAFLFSLPVFWYFGTYLRDGFIFAITLILLAMSFELTAEKKILTYNKLLLFFILIIVLGTLRFYYAIPFLAISIFAILRNINGIKRYALILLVAFFALETDIHTYILNYYSEISINILEIIRLFLNPLPAISFGEDVERYESIVLYNLTFILRLINTFIFIPAVVFFAFKKKYRTEFCLKYILLIIFTFIVLASGNIGPRQSFLVGLMLFVLFIQIVTWKKI